MRTGFGGSGMTAGPKLGLALDRRRRLGDRQKD